MPQQFVEDGRARLADFASTRARAMQNFQPVRFNLEKTFVAGEFSSRITIGRRWQTFLRVGFDFSD